MNSKKHMYIYIYTHIYIYIQTYNRLFRRKLAFRDRAFGGNVSVTMRAICNACAGAWTSVHVQVGVLVVPALARSAFVLHLGLRPCHYVAPLSLCPCPGFCLFDASALLPIGGFRPEAHNKIRYQTEICIYTYMCNRTRSTAMNKIPQQQQRR